MTAIAKKPWEKEDTDACPVADTLRSIGGKHTPKILHCLTVQDFHFLELTRALPQISRKVLADELRRLEDIGLVNRIELGDARNRVRYTLSNKGHDLAGILGQIYVWAEKHSGEDKSPSRTDLPREERMSL